MNIITIPTFVINLKNRTDRKDHIVHEFSGRDEFKVTIVEPQKDENPALSLWLTIKHIVKNMIDEENEFFLLCEDDHQFTEHYQKDKLLEFIIQANKMDADILSGGVSAMSGFIQVHPNLFWMGYFSGLQFTIVYKRFFQSITTSNFEKNIIADLNISKLTDNRFLIYPFVSVQKEFGYSDVTSANNLNGRVDAFFEQTDTNIKIVQKVSAFYKSQENQINKTFNIDDYTNISIPTYIINLPEREDRLIHIKNEFAGRDEFDIKIVEAIKHERGNLGLWRTIRKIIESAITEDHDIVILCEDDHEFTPDYSKNMFIKSVVDAHILGGGILLGGISNYTLATLASNDLFWVNSFFCTQFTIVYKPLFQKILDEPFDETITVDGIFSEITSNKLVTFPFISTQKSVGDSSISPGAFNKGQVDSMFKLAQTRLSALKKATSKYASYRSE